MLGVLLSLLMLLVLSLVRLLLLLLQLALVIAPLVIAKKLHVCHVHGPCGTNYTQTLALQCDCDMIILAMVHIR